MNCQNLAVNIYNNCRCFIFSFLDEAFYFLNSTPIED